ncbi:homeobox and C2H2 transcription factor [Aspergillus niger]|uniref:Homeobox and C2H2 transcription factor n=1 Tax=Aspergillus niger TaxID=5061 RepID=A0A100IP64_ASPNG|nr:homeobox and C2H2 transcription factor [Aspergillus niger]
MVNSDLHEPPFSYCSHSHEEDVAPTYLDSGEVSPMMHDSYPGVLSFDPSSLRYPVDERFDGNQHMPHLHNVTETYDSFGQISLDSSIMQNDPLHEFVRADCISPESLYDSSCPEAWSMASLDTGAFIGERTVDAPSALASGAEYEQGGRKRKSHYYPREIVRILRDWLDQRQERPLATKEEREELLQRTGLTRAQFRNWLANTKRREKVRLSTLQQNESLPPGAVDIPHQSVSQMTPFERWKYSPPEHEPAAPSDIAQALSNLAPGSHAELATGSVNSTAHSLDSGTSQDSHPGHWDIFQTPSVGSHQTSRSSSSSISIASAFSQRSLPRSSLPGQSNYRRHRRRRQQRSKAPALPNNLAPPHAPELRRFQCTFCTDTFKTKYDWQRHEKSLHLSLEEWTCSPFGGIVPLDGHNVCALCLAINPDEKHLDLHEYYLCHEKGRQERIFSRKDHLHQHLRLVHNVKFGSWMESWKTSINEIQSRCGFCDTNLNTWTERVEHLATHFKAGMDMRQWQGDWGFETAVQGLVENAMPPYLIGQERLTTNPYSAKSAKALETSFEADSPAVAGTDLVEDVNHWRILERELTDYIKSQLEIGVIPLDSTLQDMARMIVYSCDDPWNQTCADNPVWLGNLKREAGVEAFRSRQSIMKTTGESGGLG